MIAEALHEMSLSTLASPLMGFCAPYDKLPQAAKQKSRLAQLPDSRIEQFGPNSRFALHLAVSDEQRLTCWNMVHQEYLSKGYAQPQPEPLRYTTHDVLPDTGTFLVKEREAPVGTISVFPDSPLGLPATDMYRQEINQLRRAGRTLAEIGRLTIGRRFAGHRKVIMKMVEIPCLYARHVLGASDVIITVNPSHRSFYERLMLFETIGEEKTSDGVCGAPAVLMRMDLERQSRLIREARGEQPNATHGNTRRTVYRAFRGNISAQRTAIRIAQIQRPPSRRLIREYFVDKRPLIPALDASDRDFLSKCYPRYQMNPS